MKVVRSKALLSKALKPFRLPGNSIGFVPTMGALHRGHMALIEASAAENVLTVVSIFVNPTQFNDPGDFEKYPRNLEADLNALEPILSENDVIYAPEAGEIYPDEHLDDFDLNGLDSGMEGEFRPGHFTGVVNVVNRLFRIVSPDKAYFGEKDYQQLTIIKHLAKNVHPGILIRPVPTVREPDGLALSSRNALLSPDERRAAPAIRKALEEAKEMSGKLEIPEIKQMVAARLKEEPLITLEYFELVDQDTLQPVKGKGGLHTAVGCMAAWVGDTRLIDNIRFYS